MAKQFPLGFFWGAGTSSHQIEGGNKNNWTEWEKAGRVVNNEQSGKAADSWHLYEKDFDVLEKLNLNMYRFSIEWSRIEPKKYEFDEKAVETYRKMLKSLRKRGVEPMVTLHHFTNPQWVGDWSDPETVDHYLEYVTYIVEQLSDLVTYWCTINEPVNQVLLGYEMDWWPPGTKSKVGGLRAYHNFADGHKRSYVLIHEIYKAKHLEKPIVGIPLSLPSFRPKNKWNPLDVAVNYVAKRIRNHRFTRQIAPYCDFLGVNYYHTFHTKWFSVSSFTDVRFKGTGLKQNDLGWNMEPGALYGILKDMKRYKLPIFITESGLPDSKDQHRQWYIEETVEAISKAVDKGVDVRGYLHWSLIDNFEWSDGFAPRFGLARVSYKNYTRTIRPSAKRYAEIALHNSLEVK